MASATGRITGIPDKWMLGVVRKGAATFSRVAESPYDSARIASLHNPGGLFGHLKSAFRPGMLKLLTTRRGSLRSCMHKSLTTALRHIQGLLCCYLPQITLVV